MTVFSEQLKKLRDSKNLSQEDLAQKLFVSRQSISKYENGEATPDMDNTIKIAEIFGVSLDYLILGKDSEKVVERVVESREEKSMNAWQFFAGYWWMIFPVGGMLLWLLKSIVEIFK